MAATCKNIPSDLRPWKRNLKSFELQIGPSVMSRNGGGEVKTIFGSGLGNNEVFEFGVVLRKTFIIFRSELLF